MRLDKRTSPCSPGVLFDPFAPIAYPDPAGGIVDHPAQRDLVPRVDHRAQVGGGVLDLLAVEELLSAEDR